MLYAFKALKSMFLKRNWEELTEYKNLRRSFVAKSE